MKYSMPATWWCWVFIVDLPKICLQVIPIKVIFK